MFDALALARARSFNELPLFCADAPFLLFLACAAAAICLSRTVDPSERESSVRNLDFAGGIALPGLCCYIRVPPVVTVDSDVYSIVSKDKKCTRKCEGYVKTLERKEIIWQLKAVERNMNTRRR